MPNITNERVLESLSTVDDPEIHKDLVTLGFVENLEITGDQISFTVMLTTPACPLKDKIRFDCETALRRDIPEVRAIDIAFGADVEFSGPAHGVVAFIVVVVVMLTAEEIAVRIYRRLGRDG